MKTKLAVLLLVSAALVAGGAQAQTVQAASSAPAAPAVTPALTPNQTIYTPRLPSAAELTNIATAQGLTIERIEQSTTQVTAVYKSANGQTTVVAYLPLPAAGSGNATVVAAPATPAPAVVYEPAPTVVYYRDYPYYSYPHYWYPPVTIGLGFGFRSGGYRGGYYGGFHHWR